MNLRICRHCRDEFNPESREKILAGGYIDECPDCLDDLGGDKSPPKYLGVTAGNGKMSDISILSFHNEEDREAYSKMWRNNSGQNKGKSCQLGRHLSATSGYKFQLVAENKANDNHKGKT